MPGLVPGIPLGEARPCFPDRDGIHNSGLPELCKTIVFRKSGKPDVR
jgi:hypothetical protein